MHEFFRRYGVGRRRPPGTRVFLPGTRRGPALLPPAVLLVVGFADLIVLGAFLLSLPISSANGLWTAPLEALFTATSAVCVTGLVVVDTATHWSLFGQIVLLVLMQIGGLGFMTGSTLLILIAGRRVTLRDRLLVGESLGVKSLDAIPDLVRNVTLFAIVCELIGAGVLAWRFSGDHPWPWAAWMGVFHAVSAFTNASFDLVGGFRSLTPYRSDWVLLLTHALLIILGGISWVVVQDLLRARRFVRWALDTKLVLVTSAVLLVAGMLGIALTEGRNAATLAGLAPGDAVVNALFLSAAARTAGFNAIDIGLLTPGGYLIVIALMFVGGAAGSTAGGIKVQTFGVLLSAIASAARGTDEVQIFRRRVTTTDVLRALAVALLSIALIFQGAFLLSLSEGFAFEKQLFEVVSAFGTVGMTTGITPEVSPVGRVVLMLIMFAGRLGPLTLALALSARDRRARYNWPQGTVRIG